MSTTETAVAVYEQQALAERSRFMPVMSMDNAIERRRVIVDATKNLMQGPTQENPAGIDYGVIPGSMKPSLLQPGADKLCNLFGLVVEYEIEEKIEDWTGANHSGEPFFYYRIKGRAKRGDFLMGEGIGSCNSWESKYRWRKAERTCPQCGKETIIKGRQEYGGGWLCFGKKGGCGAKFKTGDAAIEGQDTGRKPNPDVLDQVNTILKMAVKRAKIAATINATSASEFFTQDLEDVALSEREDTHQRNTPEQQAALAERRIAEEKAKIEAQRQAEENPDADSETVPDEVVALWKRMGTIPGALAVFAELKQSLGEPAYYRVLTTHGVEHANQFSNPEQARVCVFDLWKQLKSGHIAPQQATLTGESDLPPEFLERRKLMKSREKTLSLFEDMKFDLEQALGNEEGVKAYTSVLAKRNVLEPLALQKIGPIWDTYVEMFRILQQAKTEVPA